MSNRPPPGTIRLHANDNVVIARRQLIPGTTLPEEGIEIRALIPPGHKIATRAIRKGEFVRRYNQVIGAALNDIDAGSHVHTHNLGVSMFEKDYAVGLDARPTSYVGGESGFMGIRRPDDRIATRNYIGILSSVNCSATVVRAVADHFRRDINPRALEAYGNVDGVVALTHGGGCGIDPEGEGLAILRRTLGGYATHPNFQSVVIIGLGCETNQIEDILRTQGLSNDSRLHSFSIQDSGGTRRAIDKGIEIVKDLLPQANAVMREHISAKELIVGLQCGGSDSYSGISANPALGAAVDILIRHGGTAILSETPEIFGAEHLLTRRAASAAVAEKLLRRIRWWSDYCARNGADLDNNPSVGNKRGGLTTVLEKSLGGVTKAGTTNLVEVYEYAEAVAEHGLVFMDTPGYDPVSATGQVAGGANLICFTTGRGSAYGCQPAPSLKLSTNTAVWTRQQDDIDLNCGGIVDGTATVNELGERIFGLMLECASGKRTKSEVLGYGQEEFVPWQISVIT